MADQAANRSVWTRQQRLVDGRECLATALDYLANGWCVTACCPPDHHGMGEWHPCTQPDKRPWHRWKVYRKEGRLPSVDEPEGWWRQHPDSNVGMAYGRLAGIAGIDSDSEEAEAKLQELSGGDLPTTLEFVTSKGGRRLLYAIPEGAEVHIRVYQLPGEHNELRLQGEGAQTVMPPSRHPNGGRYAWKPGHAPEDIDPAPMPAWMLRAMAEQPKASGGPAGEPPRHPAGGNPEVIGRATAHLEKCQPAVSGQGGHSQTFTVAREIVWGFDLGEETGFALLWEHYNPRCQPPWSEGELRPKCEDADEVPYGKPRGWLLHSETAQSEAPCVRYAEGGVTLTATRERTRWSVTLRRGEAVLGVGMINPAAVRDRRELLRSVKDVTAAEAEVLENLLLRLATDGEADLAESQRRSSARRQAQEREAAERDAAKAAQKRREQLAELEAAARPVLDDPALLYRVGEALRGRGLVGERGNGLLLYLCLVSQVTDDPISAVVNQARARV